MSKGSEYILACINMNSSSFSHKLQCNIALASNIEDPTQSKLTDNVKQAKSKKKIFEYRGSTDLANKQL